jgi:hypothetical protein
MQRTDATPTRPTPRTVAEHASGLTATGLTALASLEANLAWELHLRSAATFEAPPPYRAAGTDDGDLTWGRAAADLTWGVRGATGHIQGAMTFGRAA